MPDLQKFKTELLALERELMEALLGIRNGFGLKLADHEPVVGGGKLQAFEKRYGVELQVHIVDGVPRLWSIVLPQP